MIGAGPGRFALLLALLAAAGGSRAAADDVRCLTFHGTARAPSGEVRYLERHEVRSLGDRPLSATTTYLAPAGEVIAVLWTDFSRDPFAPSYRFEDRRGGQREEVEVSAHELTLVAGERRRTLARPADPDTRLVTGQGMERYVRQRLADLEAGADLRVAFAIPSRQDVYDFRVRARPTEPGAATLRVRVELGAWVLRLFAGALEVDYDRATRRLVRYRGPSNLRDERGENPEVVITYDDLDDAPGTANAEAACASL